MLFVFRCWYDFGRLVSCILFNLPLEKICIHIERIPLSIIICSWCFSFITGFLPLCACSGASYWQFLHNTTINGASNSVILSDIDGMWQDVYTLHTSITAAVAQSVRAFAPAVEGWVFESFFVIDVVKTGSESSTAKHSAVGVNTTGLRRLPL